MSVRKAGQSSVESMLVVGIGLALLAVIIFTIMNAQSGGNAAIGSAQGRNALDDLAGTGKGIYEQGSGSRSTTSLTLPADATQIDFSGSTMLIRYRDGHTEAKDVDYAVFGSVSGSGTVQVPITALDKGICFGDTALCISCGDSSVDGSEQCDDGNQANGDGCSALCQIETIAVCGDGAVNLVGEQCDDGNTNNGDGCNSQCIIETTPELCGDGSLNQANETCDDGNTLDGDGCSGICIEEIAPEYCGDAIDNATEECDDGNNEDYDGCSSTCLIENDASSITMCLVLTDARGNFTVGSSQSNIRITLNNSLPGYTTGGTPTGTLPNFTIQTPFTPNKDLFGNDGIKEGRCFTQYGLVNGNYYYSNIIVSGGSWQSALYNDQYSQAAINTSYFYPYDYSVFDHNTNNDGGRNRNADGEIVLVADRSTRAVFVLIRYPYVCGDGVINQANETCDDGNYANGDGCSSICQSEVCGNAICDISETVDSCAFDCGGLRQGQCLQVNSTGGYLENSGKRVRGLRVRNICADPINFVGANITVTGSSKDLRTVNLSNQDKWSYTCTWGCTPSGQQSSGKLVYFNAQNATPYTLAAGVSAPIERIEYDASISGQSLRVGFQFNDSSKNTSSSFTLN